MRVMASQIDASGVRTAGDRDAHIRRVCHALRSECAEGQTELILLPELSSMEYSSEAFENLHELAEPLDGPSFEAFSSLARELGASIAYGFPRVENGSYYISHAVTGPGGQRLCHYDKLHIVGFGQADEKNFFRRGSRACVLEIGGLRLGLIICYDFRFQEYIRHLVRTQCLDVVLHPSAFTRDGSFSSWHHFAITRALENQVYFLSVNRAGRQWGRSILCPPWMDGKRGPHVLGEGEEFREFNVDRAELASVRGKYPFMDDMLDDYGGLGTGERSVSPCD
jgi:nitrilase